jgi:hypothetical protein
MSENNITQHQPPRFVLKSMLSLKNAAIFYKGKFSKIMRNKFIVKILFYKTQTINKIFEPIIKKNCPNCTQQFGQKTKYKNMGNPTSLTFKPQLATAKEKFI